MTTTPRLPDRALRNARARATSLLSEPSSKESEISWLAWRTSATMKSLASCAGEVSETDPVTRPVSGWMTGAAAQATSRRDSRKC